MPAILRLLGAPAFEGDTAAHRFAAERVYQVIAYLACKQDWVQRGVLAALFYGEHPEEAARRNLRKLLLRARAFDWFERGLETTRDSARLRIDTDLQQLSAAAREQRAHDVIALYRGRLLEGLDAPECRGYTDWLATERERLRMLWRAAMLRVIDATTERTEVLALSTRLLTADPLDEGAVRVQLVALTAAGEEAHARRVYRDYAERLERELGVEPSVDLRSLIESPRAGAAASGRVPSTRRAGSDDGFIGRVAELQQIATLLAQDDCRLLTLVGPGGVGKSSLARRVLSSLVQPDVQTRFVALEDVPSADEIGARLARELELRLAGAEDPLQQVIGVLRSSPWLLVLDNFEHLAPEAALLGRLLDACPQLRLIVTSRARLELANEWLLPVEGLPYPAPEDEDRAEAFDAVRLFNRSARRVKPTFLPAAERGAIVELCRRVEGLPLALEITAAWTRVLSCAAIVAELERGTELLRAADATRPARQASIEAVFGHSWRLLAPVERDALARLSIFRSSVARDTACAITGASLPVLAALADKSLLQISADDRCSLHPLVQRFAGEQLQPDSDVAQRHGEHYCNKLAAYVSMGSVDQRDALRNIEPEMADAVAALAWARTHDRVELAGPCALVLAQIFDLMGRPRDGLAALGPLLEPSTAGTRQQARALGQLGIGHATLLARLARFAQAIESASQALRAYRNAGNGEGMRMALSILSTMALKLGRHAESRRYCQHGLKAAERAGDQVGIGTFLNNLGQVDNELGNWDTAIDHYERALEVNRRVGNQVGVLSQLNNLALAHIGAGRYTRAHGLLTEGLRQVEEAGFDAMKTYFLANLARANFELGRTDDAARCAADGLALAEAFADPTNVPGLLIVQADLARARRQFAQAFTLVRRAAQVTRSTQHRRWLVRSLMAHARVLVDTRNVAAALRIARAIEAAAEATGVEVAGTRTLREHIAGTPDSGPDEVRSKRHPSLEQLLAEVADGVAAPA
jgi:predicted ATPase/DNA-binding SARP family transcriptional activator